MPAPIIQKTGSVSGASVSGQGSNDLVAGETVSLADLEAANASEIYNWTFEDVPIDTAPVMLNATTSTPSFVVDPDPKLAGSYVVKCTINGIDSSVEVFGKPLTYSGGRIPSYKEQEEFDGDGNAKGWHEAETVFKRSVDELLGDVKASITERQGGISVPSGSSSKEIELGGVVYPGYLLAIAGKLEKAVVSGNIVINIKIGGVIKLTTTLSTIQPTFAVETEAPGTHAIVQGDPITVEVIGSSYVNASADASGLSLTAVLSSNLSNVPLTIGDASNTTKGITKLSVAPVLASEPIALGVNDGRVPTQNENDALAGTAGVPAGANPFVTDSDPRNSDSRTPTAHDLDAHGTATLAELNAVVSDATLIDTGDSRLSDARVPTSHGLGGTEHATATLAQLNSKVSDATLDGTTDPRDADAIITTTGPTTMAVGAVGDGEFLQRSGSTVIGATPAAGAPPPPSYPSRWAGEFGVGGNNSRYLSAAGLDISDDYTIEGWFKPAVLSATWNTLVGKGRSSSLNLNYALGVRDGEMRVYSQTVADATIAPVESVGNAIGVWAHYAATRDRATGEMKLFFNGLQVGTTSVIQLGQPLDESNNQMRVGAEADQVSPIEEGRVFDIRVWNVVRTPDQIKAAYNKPLSSYEDGLLANYQFLNNWDDSSPNAFHLVSATGTPTLETDAAYSMSVAGELKTANGIVVCRYATHPTAADQVLAIQSGLITAEWVDRVRLDAIQQYTKNQHSHIVTLTDATTINYLASDSNIFKIVATNGGSPRTLANPTGVVAGMTWQVWFWQDPTDGLEPLLFGSNYDWGDEGAPDFSAQVADVKNIITCVALSATQIAATVLKGFA